MRQEWMKLIASRIITMIAVVFLILNTMLYYNVCKELIPIKEQWAQDVVTLQEEKEDLQQKIEEGWMAFEVDVNAQHEREIQLATDEQLLERKHYTEGYHAWLMGYIQEMNMKLEMGMFTPRQEREVVHGIKLYEKLESIEPGTVFQGTAETLLSFSLPMIFTVIIMIIGSMFLFQQDKRDRMDILFRTMPRWKKTAVHKTAAILTAGMALFMTMLGIEVVLGTMMLGPMELKAPIQSVYGLHICPFSLSVGGYLGVCLGWQILMIFVMGIGIAAIMHRLNLFPCVVVLGGLLVLSMLMASSTDIRIDTFSLITMLNGPNLFSHDFMLFFGPVMVPQVMVMLIGCSFLIIGALYILRKDMPLPTNRKKYRSHKQFRFPKTLQGMEDIKLAWHSGAIGIILILSVLVVAYCGTYRVYPAPAEYLYRQYSIVLEGSPSPEKDAFIVKEQEKLAKDPDENMKTGVLLRARMQYEAVPEDGQYVYETGYTSYFSNQVKRYRKNCLFMGTLAVLFIFAWNSGMEQENAVDVLAKAYRAKHKIGKVKLRNAVVVSVLVAIITTLPMLWQVHHEYGFRLLTASATSVALFHDVPKFVPLWGILLLPLLFSVLVYMTVWKVSEVAAVWTKKTMYTMAVAGMILIYVFLAI